MLRNLMQLHFSLLTFNSSIMKISVLKVLKYSTEYVNRDTKKKLIQICIKSQLSNNFVPNKIMRSNLEYK